MYDNFFLVVLFVLFVVSWISGYFTGKSRWYCQNVLTFHFPLHTIFCLRKMNLMWISMISWRHFNVWVWFQVFLSWLPSQYCTILSCYHSVDMAIHFTPAMVLFYAGGAHFSFCSQYLSLRCCDVANDLVVCGLVHLIIIVLWVVTSVYLTHYP